jgi:hypothetical protein
MPAAFVFAAVIAAVMASAMSWYASTSSAGPAKTVAAAMIEYHQASVAAVQAAPTLAGAVTPTLAWWQPAGAFASCADGAGIVGTYSLPELVPAADRVAKELAALVWDAGGYGVSQGGVVAQRSGASIAFPCAVADGRAVAVTRTR